MVQPHFPAVAPCDGFYLFASALRGYRAKMPN